VFRVNPLCHLTRKPSHPNGANPLPSNFTHFMTILTLWWWEIVARLNICTTFGIEVKNGSSLFGAPHSEFYEWFNARNCVFIWQVWNWMGKKGNLIWKLGKIVDILWQHKWHKSCLGTLIVNRNTWPWDKQWNKYDCLLILFIFRIDVQ